MSHKMTVSIKITNEEGQELVKTFSEKEIPGLEEFEQQGFRSGFHQFETAVLEARKEAGESAAAEYMEHISKKKLINSKVNIQNPMSGSRNTATE